MKNILDDFDVSEKFSLPFNGKKQEAILGHLIVNEAFFSLCRNKIKDEWFTDPYCQKVYRYKSEFVDEHKRSPTVDELKHSSNVKYEQAAAQTKIHSKINDAIREAENFKVDVLSEELEDWLKARIFYEGVLKAKDKWNNERFRETYDIQEEAVKKIKEASFLRAKEESFADFLSDLAAAKEEQDGALTFGIDLVDRLLVPDPDNMTTGGLLPGDTTVILAPTNTGKTTSMITTLVANVKQQRNCVLMTHEGRAKDIKEKIRCCFLGVDRFALRKLAETEEGRRMVYMADLFLERYLTYSSYNKAGLQIEEVDGLIRRKADEIAARTNGVGIELFVCDYPAKLTTRKADMGHLSKRHIDEIVYGYYVQYALEYNWHSLVAIQTNREGAKVNKGQRDGERRLLTMEDVHESYGPMQEATNVITLNRDPFAKALGRLTYYIDKSRSSDTGWAVVCKSKFNCAITHSTELGGVFYRGTGTMADVIDGILADPAQMGKEIKID